MERDRFEDLGVNGSIVLKLILNCLGGCVLVLSGSGQGQMSSCCGRRNESSGSIKCG
jgi:hypothetical protein